MNINIHREIDELRAQLISVRRDLHMHPELAFNEHRTAGIVAAQLRSLGYHVQTGVAQTGVVGVLEGSTPGKTLMLRADIDALPIQEIIGRPYGSIAPGKMHACGHDGHTSIGLAVAAILARHRRQLNGQVKMVFQPAEEVIAGGKAMIEAGVMKAPVPDRVIGLHLWAGLEVGKVSVHDGFMWASVDEVKLTLTGDGAHGGTPHLGTDPLLAAAHVVIGVQALTSREVSTFQPAVFTQGILRAGSSYNVIPQDAEIRGSCRAMDPHVREFMHRRIREITQGIAASFRCQATVEIVSGTPPVYNDVEVCESIREAAAKTVGADNVVDIGQSTAGDDVAYFLDEVPGCYFLVGAANSAERSTVSHHTPEFDIDEGSLPIAAEVMARAAIQFLM